MNLITTLAQAAANVPQGKMVLFVDHLVAAIIYAVLGILILLVTLYAMVRLAPFSIHKEIEEDQNVALGIVIGAVLLGIALIIAAAISG